MCLDYTKISKIRNRKGVSIQQLSDETGITRATIYRIEAGGDSPNICTLVKICRVLRLDINELINHIGESPCCD